MSGEHDHGHGKPPTSYNAAFAIGIGLNIAFVAVEALYGWKINSLALLADAGHKLSDVIGLVLAWGGALAGKLRPDARHTYGWKRASILAAFINALLLLVAMGSLVWEALHRLQSPVPTEGATIMVVAGAMALWFGWAWLDPVVSLLIAAVIVWGTWNLFRQSLHLLFDGVPEDAFLQGATEKLHDQFDIEHVTLQVVRVPFTAGCFEPPAGALPHRPRNTGRA